MNMKQYHDITLEAQEMSSLGSEDEDFSAQKMYEHEAGSEGGPSPAHKKNRFL